MTPSIPSTGMSLSGQAPKNSPKQTEAAAKDFEALLLSQMLHSMRESSGDCFGAGQDQAMDAAMGIAEEQFGRALAAGGGIGLTKMVAKSLAVKSSD